LKADEVRAGPLQRCTVARGDKDPLPLQRW
jgi:hypothetical protein